MGLGWLMRHADLPLGEKYFSEGGIWIDCFYKYPGVQGSLGVGRLVLGVAPTGTWE